MQKLLVSSSVSKTIKESCKIANTNNIGIEISRLPFYNNSDISIEDAIKQLKEDISECKGRLTVHAMFSDLNIGSKDKEIVRISDKRYKQSFELAKAIGADTILFHSGNKGTKHYESQKIFQNKLIEYFKTFAEDFEKNNIIAVIENVFEKEPEYLLNIVEKVNSPFVKLALDTGHANLFSEVLVEDWIKSYGSYLHHMHIHNNFKNNDDHSNLLNGTLNFVNILTVLKQTNIQPTIVFEMFKKEDLEISLKFYKSVINRIID